jgi:predicted enzyme related to lactoylglutathione lyase
MGLKIVHWEVLGNDAKKLQDFYATLFEWNVDASNPMNYGMVDADQSGIGGGIGAGDGQSYVTFYVEVDDLRAALDKAESLGGSRVQGPMEVPGGPTLATFTDPEGHLIGLVKSDSM